MHLATRTPPAPDGRPFASLDSVLESHARGALALADTIRIAGRTTTVGRCLVAACLPPAFRDAADAPWHAVRAARLLARITRELHVEIAARAVEALELLGRHVADRSGFSLTHADFAAPIDIAPVLAAAAAETSEANRGYDDGMYTDGERYNRIHEAWWRAAETARAAARDAAPIAELEALQRASRERNGRPAVASPALRGIRSLAAQRPK